MLKAQEVQKNIQQAEKERANNEYEGSSGGGMVTVTMDGGFNAKKAIINDSLINKNEKEILEDLIVAAINDAKKKADQGYADSIRAVTNGIPLPPGFKF
jgi:DNA-binding YbaB/EbfC family protein